MLLANVPGVRSAFVKCRAGGKNPSCEAPIPASLLGEWDELGVSFLLPFLIPLHQILSSDSSVLFSLAGRQARYGNLASRQDEMNFKDGHACRTCAACLLTSVFMQWRVFENVSVHRDQTLSEDKNL